MLVGMVVGVGERIDGIHVSTRSRISVLKDGGKDSMDAYMCADHSRSTRPDWTKLGQ